MANLIRLDLQPLRDALAKAKAENRFAQEFRLLSQYIPHPAVDYAMAWYITYPFKLIIEKPRESKFGDYRPLANGQHQITVNGNLPPQAFLLTYLHEVAHMMVIRLYKERVQAHGSEWKTLFSQILQPMLNPLVFDEKVLPAMRVYAQDPKASSSTDPDLMRALHLTTNVENGNLPLQDFNPNTGFKFQLKGQPFVVKSKARTTYICENLITHKLYKVRGIAFVEPIK